MKAQLVLLTFAFLVSSVCAATFEAFIDIGPPTGQLEPGAVSSGGSANNTNNQDLAPNTLTATTGQSFTLAIDARDINGTVTGGIDWRDRGDASAGTLHFLAEDFVKNNSGIVRLSFTGLPAGLYEATSYHIDPQNSQSDIIEGWVNDVRSGIGFRDTGIAGDASYPGHPANTGAPGIAGLSTAIVQSHSMTLNFVAGSGGTASILYDGRPDPDDDESPINGIQLNLVKEMTEFAVIDIGPAGQRVLAGAEGIGTASSGANGQALSATSVTAVTADVFQVALSGVDWRDRGDGTPAQPQTFTTLAEDFVKNNGGNITLTLTDLPAGEFFITSYHVDPDFTQAEQIDVYVTDATGTDVLQSVTGNANQAAGGVNAFLDNEAAASSASYFITSDGVNPVVIRFDGSNGLDTETPLNGLQILQVVPEPGTFSLLAISGLGIALRRRKKA